MSTSSQPTQQPVEAVPAQPPPQEQQQQPESTYAKVYTVLAIIAGSIMTLIPAVGAAKLSHDRFGSIGWAIVAFIFAPFYYIYYAYFVSTKVVQPSILGGRRRR